MTKAEKATHTAGPWIFEQTTLSICRGIVTVEDVSALEVSPESDRRYAIAYLPNDAEAAQQEANAHLISAAPDLLAALHGIRKAWATYEATYSVEIERMIDRAISKAEGGV